MTMERLVQLFKEYYMPTRNTYHSRGDLFWAKPGEGEIPGRKTLAETGIL